MKQDNQNAANLCDCCEPFLELLDRDGRRIISANEAIPQTELGLLWGKIMALSGFGQKLFLADARKELAVSDLRQRARWGRKALPLLYPSIELLLADFEVSEFDWTLLNVRQTSALLLNRKPNRNETALAVSVTGSHHAAVRVMLPSTPLQRLLLGGLNFPLAAIDESLLASKAGIPHHIADFTLALQCPAFPPESKTRCAGPFADSDWVGARAKRS